ncbi:MAG: hypothetical protein V1899_02735 [Planctomycetota bacterium]
MPNSNAVFTIWDWSVLIVYFVGITVFGLWIAGGPAQSEALGWVPKAQEALKKR